jgi:hypothetical protein
VVDTISRKAYFHPPLISQEQPHSMRMFVWLVLKVTPYGLSFQFRSPIFTWWLIEGLP